MGGHSGLCGPRTAADGPGGAAFAEGRDDPARGEGVFDLRGAHALGVEGQGGDAGGTGGAGVRDGGPVSVHPAPQDPVGGRRCGLGGADGGGDASPSPRPAGVQLRSRFSQPGEPRPSRRVARLERAAAQGDGGTGPSANASRTMRLRPRAGSIRRWSRRSMRWSTAVWTACAPGAPTGSRAPWRCRCWPPTCIGWAGSCASASASDDDARPERPHPAMVPARRETGTGFHARAPEIRADGSPSGPMAPRRASNATAAADTKARSTPKLLLIHSPIARKRGFLADTN